MLNASDLPISTRDITPAAEANDRQRDSLTQQYVTKKMKNTYKDFLQTLHLAH